MAGDPIRWADINAFTGTGGCGDIRGGFRRTHNADSPRARTRLNPPSPSAAPVVSDPRTDSLTEAPTDPETESVMFPSRLTERARRGGGVQRSSSVEGAATARLGGEARNRRVVIRTASQDDSWEALEQQCRRMEAVGLRIDHIDLTCCGDTDTPDPVAGSPRSPPHSPLSPSSAGLDSADSASARARGGGEARGAGETAQVRYAFGLVSKSRASRDEGANPEAPGTSGEGTSPEAPELDVRLVVSSLDGGGNGAMGRGRSEDSQGCDGESLDFSEIFPGVTSDRVTFLSQGGEGGLALQQEGAPQAGVFTEPTHARGRSLTQPCAPALVPGVVYSANRGNAPGNTGQGLFTPLTSTLDSPSARRSPHGPLGSPSAAHNLSSFRYPSYIPSQASHSPTSPALHSFAPSPPSSALHSFAPSLTSSSRVPPLPPTKNGLAPKPARGFHRRSNSLSVLTEYQPGVQAAHSPNTLSFSDRPPNLPERPANLPERAASFADRPPAPRTPGSSRLGQSPRDSPTAVQYSAGGGTVHCTVQMGGRTVHMGGSTAHMQQYMQHKHLEQMQQMQLQNQQKQQGQQQQGQQQQQHQQKQQGQAAQPVHYRNSSPRPLSAHRFTPSLPEIAVGEAGEWEGFEEDEVESPVALDLPRRFGSAPNRVGTRGSPSLGHVVQAGRPCAPQLPRRSSPGGGSVGSGPDGQLVSEPEIQAWEVRSSLMGQGRSLSTKEYANTSMVRDDENVLADWSAAEADAEWIAVGKAQGKPQGNPGVEVSEWSGSSGSSGRSMKGGSPRCDNVRCDSMEGQEEGVRSKRNGLRKMLWRFKSGPVERGGESPSVGVQGRQQQEEQQRHQQQQQQQNRSPQTVRVFEAAEC